MDTSNELKSQISCNICQNNNTDFVTRKGQWRLPINVVLCKNCGLGYLNPRWTKQRYDQFYANEYDNYYRKELTNLKSNVNLEAEDHNSVYQRLKDNNLFPDSIENILDIGSGDGKNLIYLKKMFPNANLYGIEPSSAGQKILKNNNIEILCNSVDDNWELKKNVKYDIIILRHVLEHFLDPKNILQKIEGRLSENGILYIAVPNGLKPFKPLQGSFFRVAHTYYFNKYSIKNILALACLEIKTIVEGDDFNQTEMFIVAKKSLDKLELEISSLHYKEQKAVYDHGINGENYTLLYIRNYISLHFPWLVQLKKKFFP